MKIFYLTFILLIIASIARTQEEAPKRPNLLARRPGGKPFGKSTVEPSQAPTAEYDFNEADGEEAVEDNQQSQQNEEEVYDDEPAEEVKSTSTTQAPKKIGPVIRPFRSNDDLLNALRRRQQNIKSQKKPDSFKTIPTKRVVEGDDAQEEVEAPVASAAPQRPEKALARKRFGGLKPNAKHAPAAAAKQEEEEEQQQQQPQQQQDEEESAEPVEDVAPAKLAKRPVRNRFAINRN